MLRCHDRRISSAYRKPHTCRQHHAAFNGGVTYSQPARTTTRRIRIRWIRVTGLLVLAAAIPAALSHQWSASSPSTATSPTHILRNEHRRALGEPDGVVPLRGEHPGALGETDGAVPDGTTVWDGAIPGVANLDPTLLSALRRAATDAADDGV